MRRNISMTVIVISLLISLCSYDDFAVTIFGDTIPEKIYTYSECGASRSMTGSVEKTEDGKYQSVKTSPGFAIMQCKCKNSI